MFQLETLLTKRFAGLCLPSSISSSAFSPLLLPSSGYAQLCLWLCGFCFGLHLRFDWQLTEMFVDTQSALRLFMVGSIKMPTGRIRIRLNLLLTASSCVYMTA